MNNQVKIERSHFITNPLLNTLYFFRSIPLMLKKRRGSEIIGLPEVRGKIARSLQLLESGSPFNNKLPWLNQERGYLELLRLRRDYIRSKWISYHFHDVLFDINYVKFNQWDIFTLYPDLPLPSLFDFERIINSLPQEIKKEYYLFRNDKLNDNLNNKLKVNLEGERKPYLWDILQMVTKIQTDWAARLFIQPLDKVKMDEFYNSLYNFSGELLAGLIIICELIEAVKSGLIFRRKYSKKFTNHIDRFFDQLPQSRVTFADLIFLHGAIRKLWLNIHGISEKDLTKNSKLTSSTLPLKHNKKNPIIDIFKIFFLKNPLSNLLMIDFLSDTRLLKPKVKQDLPKIGWLFQTNMDDEILFWLANHLYSDLMSSYPAKGSTCFGTDITDAPQELFLNRVGCLGQFFHSINEEIEEIKQIRQKKENKLAKNRFLRFLIYFYEILWREWLIEAQIKDFPAHPLPEINEPPPPPQQILLSYLLINKSRDDKKDKIVDSLRMGKPFSDLAREYSEDSLSRYTGGEKGWIKRGDLPYTQETAVFLFPKDNTSFLLTTEDAYHFFLIHERKFSEKTLFFERLIQWSQREDSDYFREACFSLLEPPDTWLKDSLEGVINKKALFYHRLLSFSKKSITVLYPT